MPTNLYKPLAPSRFKGVHHYSLNGIEYWKASKQHNFMYRIKRMPTEHEAAVAYDLMCIEFGLPPVNILKPKI